MLKSKINAVVALKELNEINSIIGKMETSLVYDLTKDEKDFFLKRLFEIVAKIMFDFESPILIEFPQLCSIDLLEHNAEENKRYKVMLFDKNSMTESILENNVCYGDISKLKKKYEKIVDDGKIIWVEVDES